MQNQNIIDEEEIKKIEESIENANPIEDIGIRKRLKRGIEPTTDAMINAITDDEIMRMDQYDREKEMDELEYEDKIREEVRPTIQDRKITVNVDNQDSEYDDNYN